MLIGPGLPCPARGLALGCAPQTLHVSQPRLSVRSGLCPGLLKSLAPGSARAMELSEMSGSVQDAAPVPGVREARAAACPSRRRQAWVNSEGYRQVGSSHFPPATPRFTALPTFCPQLPNCSEGWGRESA